MKLLKSLWNKADFVCINQLVIEFANSFLHNTIDTPVQDLWDAFKSMCMNCLQLVPTKTAGNVIESVQLVPGGLRSPENVMWR